MDPAAELPDTATAGPESRGGPAGLIVTRRDVACIGPIIVISIYFLATTPITPPLIGTHPVLLSALRGSTSSIIAAGARGPVWAAILAPVFISVVDAPFYYWAGRRYGRRILDYYAGQSPRWKRRVARGERAFARWGPWTVALSNYLPLPNALLYIAAGEARMSLPVFAGATAFAALSWIGLWVALGWWLGSRATHVAEAISHYGLWLTIAIIGGIMVSSLWRGMRRPAGGLF